MVDQLQSFLKEVTCEDSHAIYAAADDYVKTIHNREIHTEVRAAADNAINAGDGAAVWQLRGLVSRPVTYGPEVKRGTVLLLMSNPQFLKYFSPQFTTGILSRYQNGNGNGHAH